MKDTHDMHDMHEMRDMQGMHERRRRPEQRARFEEIRTDIAERVRAACRGLPAEECEALLSRMARVQLKYELTGLTEVS